VRSEYSYGKPGGDRISYRALQCPWNLQGKRRECGPHMVYVDGGMSGVDAAAGQKKIF